MFSFIELAYWSQGVNGNVNPFNIQIFNIEYYIISFGQLNSTFGCVLRKKVALYTTANEHEQRTACTQ